MAAQAAARPFPTLAFFCVYNRALATGARDEHDEEDAGCLYVGTRQDLTPFRRARKVGLAQGLVDFTRMLSHPGEKLKAVHSSQQRMLFYEPEDGYVLHAVIDLARLPVKDKAHARTSSQASERSTTPTSVANDEGLEDEALLAGLRALYEDFVLLHGSLASIVEADGRAGLSTKLAAYFDDALWRWHLERAVLGVADLTSVLGALPAAPAVAAIAALPELASAPRCILLDHDDVLHLPPPVLVPLARHLRQRQPKRPKKPPDADRNAKPAPLATSTASRWTLGLADYLAVPSRPTEPVDPTLRASPSRSWLRVGSWGSVKAKTDEKPAADEPKDDVASDSSSEIAEHIARQAVDTSVEVASEPAPESVQIEAPPADPPPSQIFEPPERFFVGGAWASVRVAQRGSLLYAVAADEAPDAQLASRLLDAVQSAVAAFVEPCVLPVFRTLADGRSAPASTHRHLVHDPTRGLTRAADWSPAEETWSGSRRSAKEADVVGALVDMAACVGDAPFISILTAHSDPHLDEGLVRTGSGQWAAYRAAAPGAPAAFLVLPRKFGRDGAEGSLLDAAQELNGKLGRVAL